MTEVTFIDQEHHEQHVEIPAGYTLMEAATENSVSGIVAECGGIMICGTCHVHIPSPWKETLPPPQPEEAALLRRVTGATADSRLSCQVTPAPEQENLVVHVPREQISVGL